MWWSRFSNLRVEPPKYSLCRTADSRGKGEPGFRVRTLTPLLCPSDRGLHSLVESNGEGDVVVLREIDLGPGVDMLHSVVH